MGSVWGSIDEKVNNLSLSIGLSSLFLWVYFNISLGSWRPEVHPNPLAILGVLLLPISLLSYFDLLNKKNRRWVKNSIMVCESVLIILIFGISLLALTIKGDGHDHPRKAYKDYDTVSFSPNWFPRYVNSGDRRYWNKVAYKFIRPKVCKDYFHKYGNLDEIRQSKLTPLQDGCCRPPKRCDFDVPPKKATITIDIDEESEWDRRMAKLRRRCPYWSGPKPDGNFCIECPKCKNAFLVTVKMEWRSMAITNLSIPLLLTTVYLIRHLNIFVILFIKSHKKRESMGSVWGAIDEKVNNLSLSIGLSSLLLWIYFNISLGSWRPEVHPNPLAILGVLLLPISLLSYFDLINKKKRRWVKNSKIIIMECEIVLIILIFGMSVLALTIKGDGHDLPGKAYKDYDAVSFSPNWFPRYVITTGDWRYWTKVGYEFIKPKVCKDYLHKYGKLNASEIHRINLTPLEAGCCRPPKQCNVDFPRKKAKNTINIDEESEWDRRMRSITRIGGEDHSCAYWSGPPDPNFCVNCPKCKNAFLVTVKMEWRRMAITNLSIILLLTTVHLINTFYVLLNQIPMQCPKPYKMV